MADGWRRLRLWAGPLIVTVTTVGIVTVDAGTAAARETCCTAVMDGLPARQAAGGPPVTFDATLTNTSDAPLVRFRLMFMIQLGGLVADHVRIERLDGGAWTVLREKAGDGTNRVKFADPYRQSTLEPGASLTVRYRLTYMFNTPVGRALMVMGAQTQTAGALADVALSAGYLTDVTAPPAPVTTTAGGAAPANSGSAPAVTTSAAVSAFASAAPTSTGDGVPRRSSNNSPDTEIRDTASPRRFRSLRLAAGAAVVLVLVLAGTAAWFLRRRVSK